MFTADLIAVTSTTRSTKCGAGSPKRRRGLLYTGLTIRVHGFRGDVVGFTLAIQ